MAVGILVKKIFETDATSAAAVVHATFIAALEQQDKEEREDAQRLIDWYSRHRKEIIEHVKEQARSSFASTSDWQFPIDNGVPRTIRRLSMAYHKGPVREYFVGGKQLTPDSDQMKAVDAMFRNIDIDRKMRALDRWSTLLNTVHAEIGFRNDAIDWDIRLRPDVTVVAQPEDFLEICKFAYSWNPIDPETLEPVKGWVYWTDELHVWISAGGKRVGMSNAEGTNPYKGRDGKPVIPIVTVRKIEDIADYWGRFGADLVDAVQAENVQLGNMWETMILQIHGQPLGINLKLDAGQTLKLGAKWPIIVEKVMKDEVQPDLKFPKPDPDLPETKDILDWWKKTNGANYGLPPSAWSLDEQRLSGFAKFMDNIELLENREEEQTIWQDVEQDLTTKSVIVHNARTAEEAKVPEDLEVRITFPPVKIPESPTEKTTRWALAIASNQATLVDFYMEEEGLDEKQALKRATEVVALNKQLAPAPVEALPDDDEEDED